MAWTAPKYSKSQVDKAGAALACGKATAADLAIIDNWRAAHNYPLNKFQSDLRKRARKTLGSVLVAQRIKRQFSIADKLKYSTTRLSAMQDIGGCRAVMYDLNGVNELVVSYEGCDLKEFHEKNDYILTPKTSGYRGIHLVYKYAGSRTEYRNLKIEIQIRTLNQHAWATAVETVDIFTKQALKSNRGTREWMRFFQLMGTAIAYRENCNLIPNTPTFGTGLADAIKHYVRMLDVFDTLRTFEEALKQLPHFQYSSDDYYFLLVLDPQSKELEMWGFPIRQKLNAYKAYAQMERDIEGTGKNAVLVSVGSVDELKRAYPNYFLNTSMFLDLVDWAIR